MSEVNEHTDAELGRHKQAELMKRAAKEAIREFLEDKWTHLTSTLGKWVLGAIGAAIVAALVWLALKANGWSPPQ